MMTKQRIDRVRAAVGDALGDRLLAFLNLADWELWYGPPEQLPPLLAIIIADDADRHAIFAALRPVWTEHQESWETPPLLLTRQAFRRHLSLHPLLTAYLDGKERKQKEKMAFGAYQVMRAAPFLDPNLRGEKTATVVASRLRALAAALEIPPGDEGLPTLFLRLLREIEAFARPLFTNWHGVNGDCEPPLRAVYEETDHVVAILGDLPPPSPEDKIWTDIGDRLQRPGSSTYLTMEAQLRLILHWETPLDVLLERYRHICGPPLLKDLQVRARSAFRQAARIPSQLLVHEVPAAYLAAGDDESAHRVVHDYQNRLLNLRLQQELLQRMHGVPEATPPRPLPGRDEPLAVRIDAILDQLDWWTDLYWSLMANTDREALLPMK